MFWFFIDSVNCLIPHDWQNYPKFGVYTFTAYFHKNQVTLHPCIRCCGRLAYYYQEYSIHLKSIMSTTFKSVRSFISNLVYPQEIIRSVSERAPWWTEQQNFLKQCSSSYPTWHWLSQLFLSIFGKSQYIPRLDWPFSENVLENPSGATRPWGSQVHSPRMISRVMGYIAMYQK